MLYIGMLGALFAQLICDQLQILSDLIFFQNGPSFL